MFFINISNFESTLPDSVEPENQIPTQALLLSTSEQITILIVDDESVNLQVLTNYLQENYRVISTNSGVEALSLIEDGLQPDLILLDVMMPRLNGYEVTRQLREKWQAIELPILLLTAKNRVEDLVMGLTVGANDYLIKPVSKLELLARLKTHLSLKTITADNLKMQAELDITRRLQQMVLPSNQELEQIEGLDIAGFMLPADEVGGDYFDVLFSDGKIKLGIGDVTGHGLESGVLMLMVQMAVQTLFTNQVKEPQEFLSILNRAIYNNLQRLKVDRNLTLVLLDYQDGVLHLTGQHEEVLLIRKEGISERVDTFELGFMVGLEEDITQMLSQKEICLSPGDGVVLYTDGITEARNAQKEQYGVERLCKVVTHHWQRHNAKEIINAVIADVQQYIGNQKVLDDMTLLILKQQ